MDEKNNDKECDKYVFVDGANEKHVPTAATLSDRHRTPREIANRNKIGTKATVNIEATIHLFWEKDLSDKSKASPEDVFKDNEVAAQPP